MHGGELVNADAEKDVTGDLRRSFAYSFLPCVVCGYTTNEADVESSKERKKEEKASLSL